MYKQDRPKPVSKNIQHARFIIECLTHNEDLNHAGADAQTD